jgi:hypothetical protein
MKVSIKMTSNKNNTNQTSTNVNDIVFSGILNVVNRNRTNKWSGTMTDLGSLLRRVLSKKQSAVLPKSPSALRVVTNRVVNRLRNKSVSVKFVRSTDRARTRLVRLFTT